MDTTTSGVTAETRPAFAFDPVEAATLVGLYPDRDAWWEYWYVLSDDVEDRDGVAADFMRWLYRIRQRPAATVGYDLTQMAVIRRDTPCQWWTSENVHTVRRWHQHNSLENYLPIQFFAVCRGRDLRESYDARSERYRANVWPLVECLERAAAAWRDLDPETRADLWNDWPGGDR